MAACATFLEAHQRSGGAVFDAEVSLFQRQTRLN